MAGGDECSTESLSGTTCSGETLGLPSPLGMLAASNGGLFVSPGHGIHPDRTIDSYELIFVRSGCLGIEEEGREFSIEAGRTLILWPGRRHRGTMPYQSDLSFYWVHFTLAGRRAGHAGRGEVGSVIPRLGRPARTERLAELFHRFLDDQESGDASAEEASLLVLQMLFEVRREATPVFLAENDAAEGEGALRHGNRGLSLAARADRFIATEFRRGIHAGDVAAALAAHPDYLARVFRHAYRRTLSEAIHSRQLAEARSLLREGGRSMEDVAHACGFMGSRYFRKLFATHQGMSPRAYQRLYARVHVNTR